MKLLIASDIHGDLNAVDRLLSHFCAGQFDYLVLLGDILNHGPRNPLPQGYDPIGVSERLNQIASQVIAVRGNCDSEVDQALLNFPLLAEYNQLLVDERRMFLCHGHTYTPENLPPLAENDLFVSGHVHTPLLEKTPQCWLLNPGSVAMPRGGHPASYAIYEQGRLSVVTLESNQTLYSEKL